MRLYLPSLYLIVASLHSVAACGYMEHKSLSEKVPQHSESRNMHTCTAPIRQSSVRTLFVRDDGNEHVMGNTKHCIPTSVVRKHGIEKLVARNTINTKAESAHARKGLALPRANKSEIALSGSRHQHSACAAVKVGKQLVSPSPKYEGGTHPRELLNARHGCERGEVFNDTIRRVCGASHSVLHQLALHRVHQANNRHFVGGQSTRLVTAITMQTGCTSWRGNTRDAT